MGTQFFPLQKSGTAAPPLFGSCLLWPNGWMDQDSTWYGDKLRPRPRCDRWGPSSPPTELGTAAPTFRSMSMWPNGRPSQQLLSSFYIYEKNRLRTHVMTWRIFVVYRNLCAKVVGATSSNGFLVTSVEGGVQSIAMSVFVCLFVCPITYPTYQTSNLHNIFTARRNARIASAVLAIWQFRPSVRPSVRLSVCHTPDKWWWWW